MHGAYAAYGRPLSALSGSASLRKRLPLTVRQRSSKLRPLDGKLCPLTDPCRRLRGGSGLRQEALRAMATYASCGNVNLPPSSIAGVDKIAVLEATDEMTAWRSGSVLSFSRTVIGVARS